MTECDLQVEMTSTVESTGSITFHIGTSIFGQWRNSALIPRFYKIFQNFSGHLVQSRKSYADHDGTDGFWKFLDFDKNNPIYL